jgi:hypothetical protein
LVAFYRRRLTNHEELLRQAGDRWSTPPEDYEVVRGRVD